MFNLIAALAILCLGMVNLTVEDEAIALTQARHPIQKGQSQMENEAVPRKPL
ncbi:MULTISPECIES: hypothetical protein [Aerosakkonema]|uniref:hypothetical protein n=1 Tax=Aerosakkonema TaxID=1246629 RepID=UPI0035B91782